MSGRNTQICCCGASTWTAVFGWIQAVVSVLAVIGSAVILAAIDGKKFSMFQQVVPKVLLQEFYSLLLEPFQTLPLTRTIRISPMA